MKFYRNNRFVLPKDADRMVISNRFFPILVENEENPSKNVDKKSKSIIKFSETGTHDNEHSPMNMRRFFFYRGCLEKD